MEYKQFIEFIDKLDAPSDLLEAVLEGYFATNPLGAVQYGSEPIGSAKSIVKSVGGGDSHYQLPSNIMGGTKSHRDYGQETRDDKNKYKFPTLNINRRTADTIDTLIKKSKAPKGINNYSLLTPQYHEYHTPGFSIQPVTMNSRMGF